MNPRAVLCWAATVTSLVAAETRPDPTPPAASDKGTETLANDIARFVDGDQLRGHFAGINNDGSISWQREDFPQPATFQTTKLRQVILRGGKAARGSPTLCHACLVNGDRIPGTLVELGEESLVIDSPFAGRITIPRNQVAAVTPNPFGGTISYCGPFNEDGWRVIGEEEPGVNRKTTPDGKPDDKKSTTDKPKTAPKTPWTFSGTAWYCTTSGPALVRDSGLGDVSLLRFTVAWRNRLQFAIAFHADFKTPPAEQDEPAEGGENDIAPKKGGPHNHGLQAFPQLFGNSYVLAVNSGYSMLHRCSFDDEKNPVIDRVQNGNMNIHLPETGESVFELRFDRKNSVIYLYVDGEFSSQWDETAGGYAGKGNGFGFLTQGPGVRLRVSDILTAEWNGMPDSARSLDAADRDVLLLTNGTDRFSGTVKSIRDEKVKLASVFADMTVPLSKVAELRFAKNHRAEPPSNPNNPLVVHVPPVGRISGNPVGFANGCVELDHGFLGKLKVNLDYASILDFQPGNSFLDDWDSDF